MPACKPATARLLLALGVLTAAASPVLALSAQDAAADFYGSLNDYASLGRQSLERRLHDRAGAASAGQRGAYAGYLYSDVQTPDDFDLERHDGFVGGELPLSGGLTLGLVLAGGSGETSMPGATADADGFDALAYATKPINDKFTAYATLGAGAHSFDARRTTLFGTALGSTDSFGYGLSAGASYLALKQDKFSVTARAGLRYDDTQVDGFTERGVVDAQIVDDLGDRRLSLDLGGSALWNLALAGRALDLELSASVEAPVVDDRDDVRAVFLNTATLYTNSFEDAEVSATLGANASYQLCHSVRVFAGLQGRAGGDEGLSGHLGLRMNF